MNLSKFHIEYNSDLAWRVMLALFAISVIVLSSDVAFAASSGASGSAEDPIGAAFCRLILILSGSVARGFATAAIFVLGIFIFIGKATWFYALMIALAIVIIFSANKFVALITGDSSTSECPTD